jgi:hypothetical protein
VKIYSEVHSSRNLVKQEREDVVVSLINILFTGIQVLGIAKVNAVDAAFRLIKVDSSLHTQSCMYTA